MSATVQSLLRKHLHNLVPYSSARDEYTGDKGIFLDANENPFDSLPEGLNRYPDPYQRTLKERISEIKNIPVDHIFLGNGSDEPIDLLIRAFCEPPHEAIIIMPPTYGMYKVSADINNIKIVEAPLTTDFEPVPQAVQEATSEHTKILFICSPNNPSGQAFKHQAIIKMIEAFPGIVVIDEAYIDFCPDETKLSFIQKYEKLIVLQTLSKAWGLASVRLGMAFAQPQIISILNKIKPPYNLSGPAQQTALKALQDVNKKNEWVKQLITERGRVAKELERRPQIQKVFLSDANFLLVRIHDAKQVFDELIDRQIIVRNRTKVLHGHNCLRITVGTQEQNNRFLAALDEVLSKLAT